MMDDNPVSIVGAGHTKFGRMDTQSLEDLIVAAGREALSDADVEPAEVDAVFLGHFN